MSYDLWFMNYELWCMIYELWFMSYNLCVFLDLMKNYTLYIIHYTSYIFFVSVCQRAKGDKKTPATTFVVITGAKVWEIWMPSEQLKWIWNFFWNFWNSLQLFLKLASSLACFFVGKGHKKSGCVETSTSIVLLTPNCHSLFANRSFAMLRMTRGVPTGWLFSILLYQKLYFRVVVSSSQRTKGGKKKLPQPLVSWLREQR